MKKNSIFSLFAIVLLATNLPAGAQTEKPTSELFPAFDGWQKDKTMQIYQPDNLWDYINGAADNFLSYNFLELQLLSYQKGEQKIVAELYRHQSGIDAFGKYSQERATASDFEKIGYQGFADYDVFIFVAGKYYVRLEGRGIPENERGVLKDLAQKIALKLRQDTRLPAFTKVLPQENQLENSAQYISKSFLGYEYLHSAFMTSYKEDETKFELFVVKCASPKECKTMWKPYAKNAKTRLKKGFQEITDPYNGKIFLLWKKNYMLGTFNLKSEELAKDYLNRAAAKL